MPIVRAAATLALAAAVGACTTTTAPSRHAVQSAQVAVERVEALPDMDRDPPASLRDARHHLEAAQAAAATRDLASANQHAYFASRLAAQAAAEGRQRSPETALALADRTDRARLEARNQTLAALRTDVDEQRKAAAARYSADLQHARAELAEMRPRATERGLVLTLDAMQFEFDSASLRPGADRAISRLARYLEAYPEHLATIEGHTDSVGRVSYNQGLSERRAASVVAALHAEGIDPERLDSRGFGAARPIDSNDTEDGRARNRRVEIVVAAPRGDRRAN